jgi:hypothetical protein
MHDQRTALAAANVFADRGENALPAGEVPGAVERECLMRLHLQIKRRPRFESARLSQDHFAE